MYAAVLSPHAGRPFCSDLANGMTAEMEWVCGDRAACRRQRHLLSVPGLVTECISTVFCSSLWMFLSHFALPPSYPFGFSHNYRLSLCDCMKGISSCYFFFSSRLQPTSCFPLVLHTHSLGGQHIMLQALLNSRNPSETLSDRGFFKQIVGKKSSAHWDLSSGKPSRRSQGVGTEGGGGGVVWMWSVKAVNRSLYVNSCLLWISRQG